MTTWKPIGYRAILYPIQAIVGEWTATVYPPEPTANSETGGTWVWTAYHPTHTEYTHHIGIADTEGEAKIAAKKVIEDYT
jgi:hypothetical protein